MYTPYKVLLLDFRKKVSLMYCPHCMKKIPRTATTCPFCAQPAHTPVAGMATLRVSCRPHLPLWIMIMQPINYFAGYNVYISVDDQNYVLKSKKKQMDIPVSIGTHKVRISAMTKKSAKAMNFAGKAMVFAGATASSSATISVGSFFEDWGKAFSDDGIDISFAANELLAIPVKQSWNGAIVKDEKE